MEIERKYLIKTMPDLQRAEVKEIEQGYLCTNPVVRIRRSNERYILTYKSHSLVEEKISADTKMCQEIEMPLTEEGYYHLREKTDGYFIAKTRYVLPLADGHMAELDVFHGRLEGLTFVEVEFADAEDAKRFQPPEWFGENVSADNRYTNSFLSKQESLAVFDK